MPAPQATFASTSNLSIACGAAPPTGTMLSYNNGAGGVCTISGSVLGVITGSHNACGGSYTETWTFTDACNRTSTASRIITVDPAPQATFAAAPNISIPCESAPPASTPLTYTNGASGTCAISGTVTSVISGSYNGCMSLFSETWTFTDACGRTSTRSRFITVFDNTAPTVTAGVIGSCYPTVAAAQAAAVTATSATDNCTGTLSYAASTTGDCSASIKVTVTDICGNSSFVTYNTRIDNTGPIVTAGTIGSCYQTVAAAEAAALAATSATDNCPGTLTKTAMTTGTCSAEIKVMVMDGCGNSASVVYNTRIDNTGPTVVCRVNTVSIGESGQYVLQPADVLNLSSTFDDCGPVTISSISPSMVTCDNINQTLPVSVVVSDQCGNSTTCTAQITVAQSTDLPSGWSNSDVNAANGSATYASCNNGGVFTVNSNEVLTSLTNDRLHMVYQQLCGDGEITARVLTVNNLGWAGIVMRESLAPGSKKVTMKTQLSSIIRREIRTTTNGITNFLNFNRPFHIWLRLVRSGTTFNGYTSLDGVNWVFAFSATVDMGGCLYTGIFTESITSGVTTTATFSNVSIITAPIPLVGGNTQSLAQTSLTTPQDLSIDVFPNPTSGMLSLKFAPSAGESLEGIHIMVLNTLGEPLIQKQIAALESPTEYLDMSELTDGVYFIQIQVPGYAPVVKRVMLAR